MPRQLREASAAREFNREPVVIGTKTDEGTCFLSAAALAAGRAATPADYANTIRINFGVAVAPAIEEAFRLDE